MAETDIDPDATIERLADGGIVVRALPASNAVRASIHAVNTSADIDRLIEGLAPEWDR